MTIILLLAVSAGCRMGVPLDRNVQISQHLDGSGSAEQPPRTRLASSTASPPAAAAPATSAAATHHRLSDSEPAAPASAAQRRVAAQKQVAMSLSDQAAASTAAPAAEDPADAEFAELIAAFRDSPPEVQQQAIRQLLAAASTRASKTEQPSDIAEQLQQSLTALPALPDDAQQTTAMPTRLAATANSPQAADSGAVSQAVVTASGPQPGVTPVSGTATDPTAAGAKAMVKEQPLAIQSLLPGHAAQDSLAAAEDAALYAELVTRLSMPPVGESDGDRFRREMIRRHLQLLAGDADAAVQALDDLPAAEQAFLRHHLMALRNMTAADGHPVTSRRFARALPEFRSAVQHLSEATEQLEIRSLAFCTEILSFGQVKRFASNRFEAGQKVILYCEIDHFVAEKNADGYETELQGSYEIFDADGTKVAGQVLPADRQICDHYLRDYFIAYQMHLPSQLQPGNYRLELSMECVKGRKYGQSDLPLVITK